MIRQALVTSLTTACITRLSDVPSEVRILNVLIASPGDAAEARDAVEHALHDWNDPP